MANSHFQHIKDTEATEIWYLRRLMRRSWTDKKTNEEVLHLAGVERSLIKTIRKRQIKSLGHRSRKNGIETLVLCGKIEGKRCRERQRTTYIDSLNNFAINKQLPNNELIQLTYDRVEWRAMSVDACTRPDTGRRKGYEINH